MLKSSKQEFKEMAELIKAQTIQNQITLNILISPVIAFIYGYKQLNKRFFAIAFILAIVVYFMSLVFYPWAAILKLNTVFCIAYLMGSYPFVIKILWFYIIKGYIGLIMVVSPLYILSDIPESNLEYLFSFIIIVLSQYLLWYGKRPVK
ncbi:hypothetical protein NBRC116592_36000 [Colwellia sp. KU-HH00111]|uniref:hypothetical protein n=1 Tax=Colwellia sp. KU-HH00111 TaxID=3127652 RepID=UPI00310756B2